MVHMECQESDHHEKLSRDDVARVMKIKQTITNEMTNPFSTGTQKLVNISSGEALSSEELLDAKKLGIDAINHAKSTNAQKINIPKIQTFGNQHKKKKGQLNNLARVISEEGAVTRGLCFTHELGDEERIDAFRYEWLEYPPSLFEPTKDTSGDVHYRMRKGTKSDFVDSIQKKVADSWLPQTTGPTGPDTVFVIDGMAFIQRFQNLGSSTFGDLTQRYLNKIMSIKPVGCKEVHFIGDRYDFGLRSLKGDERLRRGKGSSTPEYIPADNLAIPEWKSFLTNPRNKENLLSYLQASWAGIPMPDGVCLTVGVKDTAKSITSEGTTPVQELNCNNHEEADSRIFAHVAHCREGSKVVISANDTDVIVLALYHQPRLSNVKELWIQKTEQFLSIHGLVQSLSEVCNADSLELTDTLLNCYVLSGCDSVSYPFRVGKRKAAVVGLQLVGEMPAFSGLCPSNPGDIAPLVDEARTFFCMLYGKPGYDSLDKLRAHMFASTKKDLRSIPPSEDAFSLHVKRSVNQISIFKQAHLPNPTLLSPEEFGRHLQGDILVPTMKEKQSKPNSAKLKLCKCKKSPKCFRNCPCSAAGVDCSIGCSCNGDVDQCSRLLEQDDTTP